MSDADEFAVTDEQLSKAQYRCKYPWTREELVDIKKRYMAKESMLSIGDSMGMYGCAIARVLEIMDVKSRPRGKIPALTAAQKTEALVMLETNTQQVVADNFGVSRWIIQKVHAEYNASTQAEKVA